MSDPFLDPMRCLENENTRLRHRIEALEAALRYTAETAAGELNYTGQSRSTRAALQKINVMARAALEPDGKR